ncbi:uncharacterized protein LOC130623829 [Hydractinia symbiolongicarpus]|uniref:uncharacterized protein LOC130623829 n=1 Tax=Hydractinia symbiolongicarpus TaxID=13093 RepID=UPI0025514A88|nr:uncharacterized protein LOC130623829 [Hydractinia symbiolongicarpus]
MPINPIYEGDDFTSEEKIPDEDFSRSGARSTITPDQGQSPTVSARDTTTRQREELLKSKVDDLYEHLAEELGQPIARFYNEFEAQGNQLLFDGIEITKRNGKLKSVAEIQKRLGTNRLRELGFTDYTTPNKGSKAMAQKLLNEIVHVEQKADDIEMMPLLENVLDETESLIEETPFGASEAFT